MSGSFMARRHCRNMVRSNWCSNPLEHWISYALDLLNRKVIWYTSRYSGNRLLYSTPTLRRTISYSDAPLSTLTGPDYQWSESCMKFQISMEFNFQLNHTFSFHVALAETERRFLCVMEQTGDLNAECGSNMLTSELWRVSRSP